jgi:hypothetical protein
VAECFGDLAPTEGAAAAGSGKLLKSHYFDAEFVDTSSLAGAAYQRSSGTIFG